MSSVVTPAQVTIEEFLALPDDGVERDLIYGQVREYGMTKRNRRHSKIEAHIVGYLHAWVQKNEPPRGAVHSGEVGCILSRDPSIVVGIDAAYFAAESAQEMTDETSMIIGPPVLAVEVLSPYDTIRDLDEKVTIYLKYGVALVWIVNPDFQTVTVFRPDAAPVLFNATQQLTAEPHLPGFSVPVAALFE